MTVGDNRSGVRVALMDQVDNVLRVALASGQPEAELAIDRLIEGTVPDSEVDLHRDFVVKFRAYTVYMVRVVTESPISETYEAFRRMENVGFINSDLRMRTTRVQAQDFRRVGRRSDAIGVLKPIRDLLVRDRRLSRLRRWYFTEVDSLISTLEAEVEQTSRREAE